MNLNNFNDNSGKTIQNKNINRKSLQLTNSNERVNTDINKYKKNINLNDSIVLSNTECVTITTSYSQHNTLKNKIRKENKKVNQKNKEKSFTDNVKKKMNELINGGSTTTKPLNFKENSNKSNSTIDPRDSIMSNRSSIHLTENYNNKNKVIFLFNYIS
jgi:hypothetical protein